MNLRTLLLTLALFGIAPATSAAAQPFPMATTSLFCQWFPSLCLPVSEPDCGSDGGGSAGVPELDAGSAGSALALLGGAALLLSTGRRRKRDA